MENEQKQIEVNGDFNSYSIDKNGNVYSKRCGKVKLLKQTTMPKGYKVVTITHKQKSFNFLVHRLVAKYFIGEPDEKLTVNHKDGNKQNNNVDNLEWVTQLENARHARRTGLTVGFPHSEATKEKLRLAHTGKRSGHLQYTSKKVIDNSTGKVWGCLKYAAIELNKNYSHLSEQLRGRVTNTTTLSYLEA